jgi:intein-encoded DNA endonuclease-like protein
MIIKKLNNGAEYCCEVTTLEETAETVQKLNKEEEILGWWSKYQTAFLMDGVRCVRPNLEKLWEDFQEEYRRGFEDGVEMRKNKFLIEMNEKDGRLEKAIKLAKEITEV